MTDNIYFQSKPYRLMFALAIDSCAALDTPKSFLRSRTRSWKLSKLTRLIPKYFMRFSMLCFPGVLKSTCESKFPARTYTSISSTKAASTSTKSWTVSTPISFKSSIKCDGNLCTWRNASIFACLKWKINKIIYPSNYRRKTCPRSAYCISSHLSSTP